MSVLFTAVLKHHTMPASLLLKRRLCALLNLDSTKTYPCGVSFPASHNKVYSQHSNKTASNERKPFRHVIGEERSRDKYIYLLLYNR
jgi:hypothetical protein